MQTKKTPVTVQEKSGNRSLGKELGRAASEGIGNMLDLSSSGKGIGNGIAASVGLVKLLTSKKRE